MTEFTYNNTKIANMVHIYFELKCNYHLYIFMEEVANPCLKFSLANLLSKELNNLIFIC